MGRVGAGTPHFVTLGKYRKCAALIDEASLRDITVKLKRGITVNPQKIKQLSAPMETGFSYKQIVQRNSTETAKK